MKKQVAALSMICMLAASKGYGQLQRDNEMIGATLSNINLSLNRGGNFSFALEPKLAWFVGDNLALGGYLDIQLTSAKGAGTTLGYGVGGFGRYYFGAKDIDLTRLTRFFVEGNVGIEGFNPATGDNTNGLGLGIGPGLSYFVSPNIGLEGLLKYGTILGFGSAASSSNLSLNIGFMIYLARHTVKQAVQDIK